VSLSASTRGRRSNLGHLGIHARSSNALSAFRICPLFSDPSTSVNSRCCSTSAGDDALILVWSAYAEKLQ
jgi:hypothetical protein